VPSQRPPGVEQRLPNRLQLVFSASVGYAILAILSSRATPGDGIADLWLPAGLSDALALRVGFWAVPVPLLGTVMNALGHGGRGLTTALTVGLGQSAGTALVALLAPRWMRNRDLFATLGNLFGFLAAVVLGALVSTLIAALVLPALRDWSQGGAALSWWAGNVAGSVVMAPTLLSWLGRSTSNCWRELRRREFLLLLLVSTLLAVVIHHGWITLLSLRPSSAVIPLTLWASFRFTPAAATPVNAGLALLLSRLPNPQDLRLQTGNAIQSQELLELTVTVVMITALIVLGVTTHRNKATRQLQQLAGTLERTIAERTQQLATANAQLQKLSDTDGLTGLCNRRRFDALLRERWRPAALAGTPLALAMVDVDHFKAYNDHYGHQAGDQCLQQVAAALAGSVRRSSDCVARYGGEEFVVLWSDLDRGGAERQAEHLRQRVAALQLPHASSSCSPVVSVSIGVAACRLPPQVAATPGDELEVQMIALLHQADQNLYAAKAAGRNRVVAS